MVKCKKTLIQAVELFLKNNDVVKIDNKIFINGNRIFKKHLGSIIFVDCDTRKPFSKKWSELTKDLSKQLLATIK
jgi:hypothetical protein